MLKTVLTCFNLINKKKIFSQVCFLNICFICNIQILILKQLIKSNHESNGHLYSFFYFRTNRGNNRIITSHLGIKLQQHCASWLLKSNITHLVVNLNSCLALGLKKSKEYHTHLNKLFRKIILLMAHYTYCDIMYFI